MRANSRGSQDSRSSLGMAGSMMMSVNIPDQGQFNNDREPEEFFFGSPQKRRAGGFIDGESSPHSNFFDHVT